MPNPKDFYISQKVSSDAPIVAERCFTEMLSAARANLGVIDLKVEISVYNEKKENERVRTEQQNKYYHKLLDIICEYTGYTHRELHEELKHLFLAYPYIRDTKEYWIVKSTKDLTSKNFGDYLEKVFNWAVTEHNIMLPSSSNYYS